MIAASVNCGNAKNIVLGPKPTPKVLTSNLYLRHDGNPLGHLEESWGNLKLLFRDATILSFFDD